MAKNASKKKARRARKEAKLRIFVGSERRLVRAMLGTYIELGEKKCFRIVPKIDDADIVICDDVNIKVYIYLALVTP